MHLIHKFEGAVFFVDILGIGFLTQNQIKLDEDDYRPWLDKYHLEYNAQHLSAAILSEFREILNQLKHEFPNVKFAQLSDCAFIWSENITSVVIIVSRLMNKCVKNGILCRGGMTFGEIIETKQNLDLGKFIVGDAVSRAVKLEGLAKGARVLIDQELPTKLWHYDEKFRNKINPLFVPFVNQLDYITYDEFKWYLVPVLSQSIDNLDNISDLERVAFTKERLKLAVNVMCSPRFNWNSKNNAGQVQLRASVNFLAENDLLNIHHNFDWTDIVYPRSAGNVNSISKKIDDYQQFFVVKKKAPPIFFDE
jgi:hypothetical protein